MVLKLFYMFVNLAFKMYSNDPTKGVRWGFTKYTVQIVWMALTFCHGLATAFVAYLLKLTLNLGLHDCFCLGRLLGSVRNKQ